VQSLDARRFGAEAINALGSPRSPCLDGPRLGDELIVMLLVNRFLVAPFHMSAGLHLHVLRDRGLTVFAKQIIDGFTYQSFGRDVSLKARWLSCLETAESKLRRRGFINSRD
jgi:hypothetical protein